MATGPGVDSWRSLFGAMKELRAAWPSRGWSWDSRQSCVSSSFSVELEPKARTATALALSTEWTSATIQRAPAPLRELAERTGGLRAGQMILASAAVGSAFGYGLWWPWGDGMTTSVRIGLGGPEATQEALQRLRDVFSVEL
ncbi:MAG TPA: hypothetical protein VIF15_20410 [Polyangiaceae bacterium]|jgi:hypothetical protein